MKLPSFKFEVFTADLSQALRFLGVDFLTTDLSYDLISAQESLVDWRLDVRMFLLLVLLHFDFLPPDELLQKTLPKSFNWR